MRGPPQVGSRRIHADARCEGWAVNNEIVQRLWREEGVRVPIRRRRERGGTSTGPRR